MQDRFRNYLSLLFSDLCAKDNGLTSPRIRSYTFLKVLISKTKSKSLKSCLTVFNIVLTPTWILEYAAIPNDANFLRAASSGPQASKRGVGRTPLLHSSVATEEQR